LRLKGMIPKGRRVLIPGRVHDRRESEWRRLQDVLKGLKVSGCEGPAMALLEVR
jgi:hypothetical protein